MPAPVWVALAADVPPWKTPPDLIDPADYSDSAVHIYENILPGQAALEGTPQLNRNHARSSLGFRTGAGAWGVRAGTGELSGSASPVTISALEANIDGGIYKAESTLDLVDNVYNWVYLDRGEVLSKTTQAAATPVPALPDYSIFLGRPRMVGGVLTEIDYAGRQELHRGMAWRRTADAWIPGDTPPAGVAFLHQTASGLWLWDGSAYRQFGPRHLLHTQVWDPGSVAPNEEVSISVTVTGAAVGDFVLATHTSLGANAFLISAHVSAADTVLVVAENQTASSVDLASGTLRILVVKVP